MPRSSTASPDRPSTPTVGKPWDRFENALGECLEALEEGEILIIARRGVNQFVQLYHGGEQCFLEAASNAFIDPPPFVLDRAQYRRALDIGWMAPTISAEELETLDATEGASPNFHVAFPAGATYTPWFLVTTLRSVYKIKKPSELTYRSLVAKDNTQIKWPTLGIERYELPR